MVRLPLKVTGGLKPPLPQGGGFPNIFQVERENDFSPVMFGFPHPSYKYESVLNRGHLVKAITVG